MNTGISTYATEGTQIWTEEEFIAAVSGGGRSFVVTHNCFKLKTLLTVIDFKCDAFVSDLILFKLLFLLSSCFCLLFNLILTTNNVKEKVLFRALRLFYPNLIIQTELQARRLLRIKKLLQNESLQPK
jgi:hypothetical protein